MQKTLWCVCVVCHDVLCIVYTYIFYTASCFITHKHHRRLQSCVGTRARLGYATFDAQLWKRIALHCMLYTVICTCVSMLMLVWGHAACLRVRSLWYEYAMLWNNPGNAWACRRLWQTHKTHKMHIHVTCTVTAHMTVHTYIHTTHMCTHNYLTHCHIYAFRTWCGAESTTCSSWWSRCLRGC